MFVVLGFVAVQQTERVEDTKHGHSLTHGTFCGVGQVGKSFLGVHVSSEALVESYP